MWYFQQVDEYLETLLLQKEVIYLTFFSPPIMSGLLTSLHFHKLYQYERKWLIEDCFLKNIIPGH